MADTSKLPQFNKIISELKQKQNAFDRPIRYKCPVCKEYTPCENYGRTNPPQSNLIYRCKQCGVLYGT